VAARSYASGGATGSAVSFVEAFSDGVAGFGVTGDCWSIWLMKQVVV